ncbi:hypothetical protein RRF57_012560 [Xylaria bambusicola]|uniref:Uncharacterized protein n=1 Tax=Xylaria bambusicola TaxID=326684 RepID=A0AAN7ZEX8_9PEZI
MAFPTSDTSARVGRGFLIILSSCYRCKSICQTNQLSIGITNHLSSANNRLASNVAHGNELFLGSENLGSGDFDTKIAAGDHDTYKHKYQLMFPPLIGIECEGLAYKQCDFCEPLTIRLTKDLGEVDNALSVFDLGNDLDVLALFTENISNISDILTTADERSEDHIDIVLHTKA